MRDALSLRLPRPPESPRDFERRRQEDSTMAARHRRRFSQHRPPDIGVGSLSTEVREDELVEIGLRIMQELGYVGTGSLQFKRDERSGDFFIIEMNTRFALGAPLLEASGIAPTLCHYCLAAGLPLPQNRSITQRGRKWICWKRDLASAFVHWRRGDLTIGQWLSSLRGRKRSADLYFRDPMPLLADIGRKLKTAFS